MILQACSGHLTGPFFHLSQTVAVMKSIVQSLQWAVDVQVTLSPPTMSSLSHLQVSVPACLSAEVLEAGSLLWHWSYSVLVWSGVTHDREEGSIRSSVKEKVKTVWIHSVFQSVCVCVWGGWGLKRTTQVIHIPLCLYFQHVTVSRAGAWQCFTRAFLWKSECASSALAREVKGRWNRWAVPMGQSWTHRYPGRARGYVASIHETSSRSNKDRLAPDWLSPSHPPLPVGDGEERERWFRTRDAQLILCTKNIWLADVLKFFKLPKRQKSMDACFHH